MHSSLKLQTNLIAIGACVLIAAGTLALGGPVPTVAWALAAVFGVAVGDLQARSIRAAPETFRSAQTAVDVRKALMATRAGRFSVLGQWLVVPLLIGAAWWSGNLIAGAVGGFAVFMAVRDAVALRAVVGLTSTTGPAGS